MRVTLNNTVTKVIENFEFGTLPREVLIALFRDGRVSSHFMEHILSQDYGLTHISGCKDHDLVEPSDPSVRYDQKTFTSRGCHCVPSNMLGQGRHFDKEVFDKKASSLIYAVVSVVNFPEIKIRFIKGIDLLAKYPRGEIKLSQHAEFFMNTPSEPPSEPHSEPHSPLI
jgi:hypothetical protein